MEFLPIDYYILLQDGYDKPQQQPLQKTNYIFFHNLPLLVKKRSYIKQSTDIVKNITYEDVMRCLDKNEAESLLLDEFAQNELVKHITDKFGPLKDFFHINYRTGEIINRYLKNGKTVASDEIYEFEQALMKQQG